MACCGCCCLSSLVFAIGALVLLRFLYRIFASLYFRFIRKPVDIAKFGKWSLVTGCTDGIGKAYTLSLARKGLNLCLIGRNREKLQAVVEEIRDINSTIECKVIVADFSEESAFYSHIESEIEGLEIGSLFNNVGVSYEHPMYTHTPSMSTMEELLRVNTFSATFMSQLVLPQMISRKRGLIINLASVSGYLPCGCPLLSVYAASKAYLSNLSKSMALEYKKDGILVESHIPFYVATKMSRARPGLTVPTPTQFVKSSLQVVGWKSEVIPSLSHALQLWLYCDVVPLAILASQTLKTHIRVMKRALERKAKNN